MCCNGNGRSIGWAGGLAVLLLVSVLWATASAEPLVKRYLAGEHYQRIDEPIGYQGEQIPVVEFFLYSCPHCYALEPSVSAWRKNLPEDVDFQRIPVPFGNDGPFYARLFYASKALGVLERMHAKVFDAIHQQGKPLNNLPAARAFFAAHGVDDERFTQTFNSSEVDEQVAAAAQLLRAFQVRGVPSFAVAGRYYIIGRMAGTNEAMLDVADYLIQQSRGQQ